MQHLIRTLTPSLTVSVGTDDVDGCNDGTSESVGDDDDDGELLGRLVKGTK